MTKFSKWKVPPTGGQARRNKLLVGAAGVATISAIVQGSRMRIKFQTVGRNDKLHTRASVRRDWQRWQQRHPPRWAGTGRAKS